MFELKNQISNSSKYFSFDLKQIKAEIFFDTNKFDLIYLDAFAYDVQPELWSESFFVKLSTFMKKDSVLVTYAAKGIIKRNLKKAGFKVETLQGPPGKREMIRAIY